MTPRRFRTSIGPEEAIVRQDESMRIHRLAPSPGRTLSGGIHAPDFRAAEFQEYRRPLPQIGQLGLCRFSQGPCKNQGKMEE